MKRKQLLFRAVPTCIFLGLLLKFPQEMTDGIRQGLTLCGTAVIPALFPFFVLCTFFTESGLCDAVGRAADPLMQRLFRLPGSAAGAVLLGLCGGYPVGTRMTAQLCRNGSISAKQAQRLCLFCVAAGPAFVTGTVGASMLRSRTCGWILFFTVTLSALLLGFLLRFTAEPESAPPPVCVPVSPAQALCNAVADAGTAMLPLCAWVLLFSGISAVLQRLPASAFLPLCCTLEVTNGCRAAAAYGLPLPVFAMILGFGGLSVHCQLLANIRDCGVRLSRFWAFRVLHGALSAVVCKALCACFPQAVPAVLLQNGNIAEPVRISVPVSAALLCTAAVFILNTSDLKKTQ